MSKRMLAAVAVGVASMALAGGPVGAQEATSATDEAAACRYGQWPAGAEGQPAGFAPGAATGVYLWHTPEGWRLRVTHPGRDKVAFRGSVTSASRIHGVERRTESRDVLVTRGTRRISYRFTNFGRVDGVDFRVSCGRGFTVNGTVDGRRLTPEQVFIGADGHHPPGVPFRVTRQS